MLSLNTRSGRFDSNGGGRKHENEDGEAGKDCSKTEALQFSVKEASATSKSIPFLAGCTLPLPHGSLFLPPTVPVE